MTATIYTIKFEKQETNNTFITARGFFLDQKHAVVTSHWFFNNQLTEPDNIKEAIKDFIITITNHSITSAERGHPQITSTPEYKIKDKNNIHVIGIYPSWADDEYFVLIDFNDTATSLGIEENYILKCSFELEENQSLYFPGISQYPVACNIEAHSKSQATCFGNPYVAGDSLHPGDSGAIIIDAKGLCAGMFKGINEGNEPAHIAYSPIYKIRYLIDYAKKCENLSFTNSIDKHNKKYSSFQTMSESMRCHVDYMAIKSQKQLSKADLDDDATRDRSNPSAPNVLDGFVAQHSQGGAPQASNDKKYGHQESFLDMIQNIFKRATDCKEGHNRYRHIHLIGEPGAGKTTIAYHIASLAPEIFENKIGPIFYIDLESLITFHQKAMKSGDTEDTPLRDSLFKYISELKNDKSDNSIFWPTVEGIKGIIENSNALIIFDGLDQVRTANENIAPILNFADDLIKDYNNIHVIITCRESHYNDNRSENDELLVIRLIGWDTQSEQCKNYITNRINLLRYSPVNSRTCKESILTLLKSDSVKSLLHIPFFLDISCHVSNKIKTLTKTGNTKEIGHVLHKCISGLLETSTDKDKDKITSKTKEEVSKLAYNAVKDKEGSNCFDPDELQDIDQLEQLLNKKILHNTNPFSDSPYMFTHKYLLDYFASSEYAKEYADQTVDEISLKLAKMEWELVLRFAPHHLTEANFSEYINKHLEADEDIHLSRLKFVSVALLELASIQTSSTNTKEAIKTCFVAMLGHEMSANSALTDFKGTIAKFYKNFECCRAPLKDWLAEDERELILYSLRAYKMIANHEVTLSAFDDELIDTFIDRLLSPDTKIATAAFSVLKICAANDSEEAIFNKLKNKFKNLEEVGNHKKPLFFSMFHTYFNEVGPKNAKDKWEEIKEKAFSEFLDEKNDCYSSFFIPCGKLLRDEIIIKARSFNYDFSTLVKTIKEHQETYFKKDHINYIKNEKRIHFESLCFELLWLSYIFNEETNSALELITNLLDTGYNNRQFKNSLTSALSQISLDHDALNKFINLSKSCYKNISKSKSTDTIIVNATILSHVIQLLENKDDSLAREATDKISDEIGHIPEASYLNLFSHIKKMPFRKELIDDYFKLLLFTKKDITKKYYYKEILEKYYFSKPCCEYLMHCHTLKCLLHFDHKSKVEPTPQAMMLCHYLDINTSGCSQNGYYKQTIKKFLKPIFNFKNPKKECIKLILSNYHIQTIEDLHKPITDYYVKLLNDNKSLAAEKNVFLEFLSMCKPEELTNLFDDVKKHALACLKEDDPYLKVHAFRFFAKHLVPTTTDNKLFTIDEIAKFIACLFDCNELVRMLCSRIFAKSNESAKYFRRHYMVKYEKDTDQKFFNLNILLRKDPNDQKEDATIRLLTNTYSESCMRHNDIRRNLQECTAVQA